MNILHINTERTWRGGEQQTLYLLRGLKERSIDSHLVCQPNSPIAKRALAGGFNVYPIGMRSEIDLAAGFRLRKIVKKINCDIIHSHTSHAHSLAFLASIGSGIKRLVTRRVDFSIYRRSFLRLNGIKYRFMADYYVAISHKIKEVLVNDGLSEQRISVVHSGIDPQRFEQTAGEYLLSEFNIADDERVVINVAHLAGHKGQKYLVRAIPHVLAKLPNTKFFIIGQGELMGELKTLASSLGLERQLIFTGFRHDVGAFYQISDLCVMSSVEEGLGTAVLDAMALGKPVVATNAGGLPEIVQDGITGRLVAPADPLTLAEGIIELLTCTELATKMAKQARALVQQCFSIQTMVRRNLEVYDKILS